MFSELERADVMKRLNEGDRTFLKVFEEQVKQGMAEHTNSMDTQPFEDLRDPTNIKFIEDRLKNLQ